jgi:hypothetical protein
MAVGGFFMDSFSVLREVEEFMSCEDAEGFLAEAETGRRSLFEDFMKLDASDREALSGFLLWTIDPLDVTLWLRERP